MEDFNVDDFIAGLKKDKSKERGSENRLYKVLMNIRSNQGTVTIVPFISKGVGNIYSKVEGVKEWYGATSLLDSGEAWYKILPIGRYKGITAEQIELYNEVTSLFDQANDSEAFGYSGENIQRVRNYSLFTGVCQNHINTENEKVDDFIGKACLFIFPSNSPIDALESSISAKADILGPKIQDYLRRIITPSPTNRHGVIQITFRKSSSPGYDANVSLEMNSEFNTIIDPTKEFAPEVISLFDDPIRNFLGWMYDSENKSYFNELAFRELRDNLKLAIKSLSDPSTKSEVEEDAPNKNDSVDPMKPPIPGVPETSGFKPPF